ncbi:hypothetical protein GCM10011504_43540 [Siccirubricoccus deserti]|nr:hypothetical protein GCM10011504_43540 [Siccirubricoccus deserti]
MTFTVQESERYGAPVRRLGIRVDWEPRAGSRLSPLQRVTERQRLAPAPWNRPWPRARSPLPPGCGQGPAGRADAATDQRTGADTAAGQGTDTRARARAEQPTGYRPPARAGPTRHHSKQCRAEHGRRRQSAKHGALPLVDRKRNAAPARPASSHCRFLFENVRTS